MEKKHIEANKNNFFIRDLSNCSFKNDSFGLITYDLGVAQLGRSELWGHTFLQAKLFAITDFLTFITNYILTKSDELLLARALLHLN